MTIPVTLASTSATRVALLRDAGVIFEAVSSGVDETAVKQGLLAEGAPQEIIRDPKLAAIYFGDRSHEVAA